MLGGALLLFVAAALVVGWGPAPGVTSSAAQAVLLAGFTALSWQLAQRQGQPARRRHFWEVAAVGGLVLAAGAVLRSVEAVGDPANATAIRTVPGILVAAGTGILLASMLARPWRLPRADRAQLWLDVVIVLIGAAVAIWVVTMIGRSEADRPHQALWAIVGAVILSVAAFTLVRMVFTRSAPVRALAGVTLALAVALFGVDRALNAEILHAPDIRAILVARMVPALLLVAGARFDQLRRPPARLRPRARRSGAQLPFVAVIATQAVLIVELAVNGLAIRTWGALAGSVAVTTLVLIRQHVVLADNDRLVARLDDTVEVLAGQEERLRYAASHDHLTGLANRARFDEVAGRHSGTHDGGRAVLLLDLDEFKQVNDTYGHHAGDHLLRVTADRLKGCVRGTDTVARLGGDEFSVLLPHASRADAVETAHRILGALRVHVRIHGRTVRPSASIGIATSGTRPFEALLRDADAAMYEAKRRNSGFHVADADI
ncbi:GGDEF domain-containing protein [Asanoa sp. NPDC050611]|uniref:GGDEF domain-containing protein n=1 Tax=Asanoa sp. NPDC050611 TaxID=3157098 RepID=UPI0033ED9D85